MAQVTISKAGDIAAKSFSGTNGDFIFLNADTVTLNLLTANSLTVEKKSNLKGDVSIAGTLTLSKSTDLSATSSTNPALIIGGTSAQKHIEVDSRSIQAKASATVVGDLNLNSGGGTVRIGDELRVGGKTIISGQVTIDSLTTINSYLRMGGGSGIEGGQIELLPAGDTPSQSGIILDEYNSKFRIFGIPSSDGTTHVGAGTPLEIDPYAKTITGGYTYNGQATLTQLTVNGGAKITGTLTLTRTADLSGTADNKPALIIGGLSTQSHIEIDNNEIQAKANGTTVSTIYINGDGGLVQCGGNFQVNGSSTMNGTLNMKNNISYNMHNSTQIPIKVYGGDVNGQGISIGAGAATIVGSGESAKSCESLLGATSEQLWLTSDNNIYFYTACQTIGNKVGVVLDTSRQFYPNANSTGALGTSSYRWANIFGVNGNFSNTLTVSTHLTVNYNNTSYALSASSFICNSWVRTIGSAGWYSETYGGGWRMTDNTWIRSYGSKSVYVDNIIRSRNEMQVEICPSGGQFRAVGGNYGWFIRNDGSNTYFMLTNGGDQYGAWNGLRPLRIQNSNGWVTMENGLTSTGQTQLGETRIVALGKTWNGNHNAWGHEFKFVDKNGARMAYMNCYMGTTYSDLHIGCDHGWIYMDKVCRATVGTDYSTNRVRNSYFSTSAPSSLENGTICFVYS